LRETPQVAKVAYAPTSRRPERIELGRPSPDAQGLGEITATGAYNQPDIAVAIPISEHVVAKRQIPWQGSVIDPENGAVF
jgi:hypothetical protein